MTQNKIVIVNTCCLCDMASSYILHNKNYCEICLDDICYLAEILNVPNFPTRDEAKELFRKFLYDHPNKLKKYNTRNILFEIAMAFKYNRKFHVTNKSLDFAKQIWYNK